MFLILPPSSTRYSSLDRSHGVWFKQQGKRRGGPSGGLKKPVYHFSLRCVLKRLQNLGQADYTSPGTNVLEISGVLLGVPILTIALSPTLGITEQNRKE